MLVFLFLFATINPKCICKSRLSLRFQVLREGSSFIAFFVEHPVRNNSKMYSVLILVVFILILQHLPKIRIKKAFILEISRAPRKKAVKLRLSWSTLYIASSKCIVSWFWSFYFDLSTFTTSVCIKDIFYWRLFLRILVTQILYVILLHCENFFFSVKKEMILLLAWSTLYIVLSRYSVS